MHEVKLRNGKLVPNVLVTPVIMALTDLFEKAGDISGILVLYDAVQMAREKYYEPFGKTKQILEEAGLLQGGKMHEATRDIIASAVEGDDPLTLVNPLAEGEKL